MKMMLLAGLIITFPALVIAIWFFGQGMMIPALASLSINFLPFIVAGLLSRRHGPDGDSDHH